MKNPKGAVDRIKIGLGIGLLAVLTGCAGGYVEGGYGGVAVVPGPDTYLFGGWGGGYERGGAVRDYSHRGIVSRSVAHGAGPVAHAGGFGGRR
jgi:hypothetical protein